MKKLMNLSEKITVIFLALSIAGFIFNLVFYIRMQIKTANLESINIFIIKTQNYVGVFIILLILFHFAAIFTVILRLKTASRESFFLAFIFFTSIISLLMIFGDFALVTDIVKEYNAALPGIESEFVILYLSQFLHFLFYCLAIVLIIPKDKIKKLAGYLNDNEISLKDEAVFINAQYIGIFTGVLGLGILLALSLFSPLWAIKKGIVTVCAVLVIPYIAIVIYWLAIKTRERVTEWYDEKQFQDVTKAGFISFTLSIVILALIFILQNTLRNFPLLSVIWFPLYFFIVLLIFSGTILYFSKKSLA